MKRKRISLLLLPLALIVVIIAIWGPETLAEYRDGGILNRITTQEAETGTEGYRYFLSPTFYSSGS